MTPNWISASISVSISDGCSSQLKSIHSLDPNSDGFVETLFELSKHNGTTFYYSLLGSISLLTN